jgi:hypothetical protein
VTFDALPPVAHLVALGGGPVTSLGGDAATVIAAGAFLGGFVAGAVGLALGREATWRDRAALNGSYVGGCAQAVALLGEAFIG